MNVRRWSLLLLAILVVAGVVSLETGNPKSEEVLDEARLAGREASSFPAADIDYFHDMDGAAELTAGEVKSRNMWLVWTGGNDRFWDAVLDHHGAVSNHSGSQSNLYRSLCPNA